MKPHIIFRGVAKALLLKLNIHWLFRPFHKLLLNTVYMSKFSQFRANAKVTHTNDFVRWKRIYNLRESLYAEVCQTQNLYEKPINYFEFGVCGGHSLEWWINKNKHTETAFYGYDTFEGLPEDWGPFKKGSMNVEISTLNFNDVRVQLYKGLFQDTLVPFLENYKDNGNPKVIHMDADLFSSTLFCLTQLYRFLKNGDVILFDEFGVPMHEFRAWQIFAETFYIKYEVLTAYNNFLFLAIKILK